MGIDAASDNFFQDKKYKLLDRSSEYNNNDLLSLYEDFFKEFAVIYFEDAFATTDTDGWKKMYKSLKDKAVIVADELILTNPFKLSQAIEQDIVGGIVARPDQIGTVSEAIAVCEIAKYKNLKLVVSARRGETADTFISDFAVGVGADYVKFGAPARERMVKYYRLLELEREFK
jgi:enolase